MKITNLTFAFIIMLSCSTNGNPGGESPLKIKKSYKQTQESNRVPGEYIITVPEDSDVSIIKNIFSNYGLIKIKSIQKYKGKQKYLIKLKRDPGPKEMTGIAEKSKVIIHIQPNYIYKIQPKF